MSDQLARELFPLMARFFIETGTWTPTLIGLTTAGTLTYGGTTFGNYTRIGDRVFINGRVSVTGVTVAPTGNLAIQGLPFTSAAFNTAGSAHFVYWGVLNLGGGANTYLGGWIESGVSRITLAVSQNGGGAAAFLTAAVAGVANGTDLVFTAQYQI
jgi:hypothetical protein